MENFNKVSIKLEYKGYQTTIKYSQEDGVFHGKLLNINDLVTFEGETLEEAIEQFDEAILDYEDLKSKMT